MLQYLRKYANNFFIKFLLGLLIISFLVWGIGDILRSADKDYVAVIDNDIYISVIDFVETKKEQLQQLRVMYPNISQEQIESLNLNSAVLNRLVTSKLLEIESNNLGIMIDDSIALSVITKNPAFQNEAGEFDRELFKRALVSNNIPESDYVIQLKNELAIKMLMDSLSVQITPSKFLLNAVNTYNNQEYDIDLIKVVTSKLPNYRPKDNEISKFYYNNITNFITPEYRDIKYITITPEQYKNKVIILEKELQTELNQALDQINTNKIHDYYDIIFDSQELAQQAQEKFQQKTTDFAQVVLESNGEDIEEYLIRSQTTAELPKHVNDLVVNMKEGEVSNVIKSDMGYHIIKLLKTTTTKLDLKKLKQETKEHVIAQKIEQAMYEDIKKIEDELSSGETLEEIAHSHKLPIRTVLMITEQGKNNLYKEHESNPNFSNFLVNTFQLPENQPSELFSIDENSLGYYIVNTMKIHHAQQLQIDQVRKQINVTLETEHKNLSANKIINELVSKVGKSEFKETIVAYEPIVTLTSFTLPRPSESAMYHQNSIIPFDSQLEILELSPNNYSKTFQTTEGDFAFAILKSIKINPTKLSTANNDLKLKKGLAYGLSSNIMQEYMSYLEQIHKVKIHTDVLERLGN